MRTFKNTVKKGDAVKYYGSGSFPKYGDVIRVNKCSCTVKLENGDVVRAGYTDLNFD